MDLLPWTCFVRVRQSTALEKGSSPCFSAGTPLQEISIFDMAAKKNRPVPPPTLYNSFLTAAFAVSRFSDYARISIIKNGRAIKKKEQKY
jgi:hypothetical protein